MNYDVKRRILQDKQKKTNIIFIAIICIVVILIVGIIGMLIIGNQSVEDNTKYDTTSSVIVPTIPKEIKNSQPKHRKLKTKSKIKKYKIKQKKNTISSTSPSTEETTSTTNSGQFLLAVDNVDPTYKGTSIALSESERIELAHLIMGEAGGEGFEGCCLLAQCVRDAMIYKGYTTVADVISGMNYSGYKYDTCQDVEDAIDYIFVQGNSAIQHRILVMYASDLCDGTWHETQNFIIQYNTVRFFDMWDV